jgi:aminoglycoside phosphotransferase (APT) family kinase protein
MFPAQARPHHLHAQVGDLESRFEPPGYFVALSHPAIVRCGLRSLVDAIAAGGTLETALPSLASLRRIAQGGQAEIFEWEENRVLRLLRQPGPLDVLERELAAMEAARSVGANVPQVFGTVTIEDRPGIILERLDGPDLLTLIGQRPWTVWASGRVTGELHAAVNRTPAPVILPDAREAARVGLQHLRPHDPAAIDRVLAILETLPGGDALCHGDFHPGQIMMSAGRPVIIDWPSAMRGDPLADYAWTRVILSMGQPPPGTSMPLKLLAKVGRRLLVGAYTRAYEAHSPPIDRDRLARWEIVTIALRILDDIPGERETLVRELRKRLAAGNG